MRPVLIESLKEVIEERHTISEKRGFVKRNSGKCVPISYSVNPLPLVEGVSFSGAIIIVRDITENVQFENSLHEALANEKRANEVKSMFLANMSHEIRTPMNGMLGMLQLLHHSNLAPEQREQVDLALSSGNNLLRLIDDILDFSKIDAGKIHIENIDFELSSEVNAVVNLLSPSMQKKNISFGMLISPDVPVRILSDPYRLRQILLNLLSNAVKFTGENGEVILRISLIESDVLKISVADNGIGIDAAGIAQLFQPFSQADQSTTRKYGGTGLGLAICKKLIERMQGALSIESLPGKGSTFTFSIKFEKFDEGKQTEEKSTQDDSFFQSISLKTLVVDDNSINVKVVGAMLKMMNCQVDTATNGKEALELLEKKRFDLVFMDCHMPVMDGFDATKKIRDDEQKQGIDSSSKEYTKIVALTADAFQSSKDKCRAIGMDDFLSKPFKIDQLKNIIYKNI